MPKKSASAKATPAPAPALDPSKLTVVYRKTRELIPYARNARTHSDAQVAQIAASIREFGWTNPILLDGRNGVLAGHGRLLAAGLLDLEDVPTIDLAHLSETQRRAYVLADNKLALNAGWDAEMLSLELGELEELGVDLDLIGFTEEEVAAVEAEAIPPVQGQTDPDAVPEVPPEPVTRLGDVWLLGRHRVMCGSSDSADLDVLMAGEKADLLLTDPPYGVSYASKNDFLNKYGKGNAVQTEIENDHQTPEEMTQFWNVVLANAHAACTDRASYYIFSPQGGDLMMMMMSIEHANWQLKHTLVWVKNNHVLGRCDYHYKHEPVFYGWKAGGTHEFFGSSSSTTVLNFDKPLKNDLHPTMKPVALCQQLLENSTRPMGLVLDIFLGSGSTLIAAEQAKRRCFGMELSPAYCDVIVRRWQEFTGQKATLEGDGRAFDEVAGAGKRAA